MAARFGTRKQICRGRLTGKEKNPAMGNQFRYADRGVDSCHSVHNHVANQKIGGDLLGHFDRVLATVNRAGFKPAAVKDERKRICDNPLVVKDEYASERT